MIGQTFGHYRIQEKLGEGGMGVVYKATDTHLDRPVAIKVLPAEAVADPERKRRFVQEARSASALNHPNIIHIYDIDTANGADFIAMEYVEGRTLAQMIGPRGILLDAALRSAIQIADALAKAHAAGIVHRDIKPANIMVTGDGLVKVLDFGVAKLTERDDLDDSADTVSRPMTEEGVILGTVAYMSPEQAQGLKVDARSDIFSFGSLLYEMLTGRRAFHGETRLATLAAILQQEPAPMAGVPPELEQLVSRCLRKDRARRIGRLDEVKLALEDLKETSPGRVVPPPTPWRGRVRWAASAAAGVLVIAAANWFLSHRMVPIDSLAVLPFVSTGGDANTEYLSEGLSESLITGLSRVPRLKVKSRDTVFRYTGKDKDVQEVGRDLGVRAVLKGRLVQRGDSLSISVELVDASDGNVLWRDQYNLGTADLLATQQKISREITQQLRLRLTGEEQQRLARSVPRDPEAYRLYLLGRYWWNQRTEPAIQKSAEYFQQAIDKEPGYALAWAGLADSFVFRGIYGALPPAETFPKARAAASQAIALEEGLAEAHASLAHVRTNYEWDWPGAEREFRRAIDLNPEYGTAHVYYAFYLVGVGRLPEALAEVRRARDVEPLSPIINANVGMILYYARQYPEAIQESRKAMANDPMFFRSHTALGLAYAFERRPAEALPELQRGLDLSQRSPFELSLAGSGFAVIGRTDEAERVVQELIALSRTRYVAPYLVAKVCATLGQRDRAFEYFDKALQEKSLVPSFLRDPAVDGLRSDPRFQRLLQRMGLSP